MYISGSRVKDFGGRVEVEAYVFDGAKAAKKEKAARDAKRGIAPPAGKQGQGQGDGKGGGAQGRRQGAGGAR